MLHLRTVDNRSEVYQPESRRHHRGRGHDLSRQDATPLATDYTLTIEEVANLYAKAGHPRTTRSLQRYCAKGHLDSQKKETVLVTLAEYMGGQIIA